jgi:hypothetical protein
VASQLGTIRPGQFQIEVASALDDLGTTFDAMSIRGEALGAWREAAFLRIEQPTPSTAGRPNLPETGA